MLIDVVARGPGGRGKTQRPRGHALRSAGQASWRPMTFYNFYLIGQKFNIIKYAAKFPQHYTRSHHVNSRSNHPTKT